MHRTDPLAVELVQDAQGTADGFDENLSHGYESSQSFCIPYRGTVEGDSGVCPPILQPASGEPP